MTTLAVIKQLDAQRCPARRWISLYASLGATGIIRCFAVAPPSKLSGMDAKIPII